MTKPQHVQRMGQGSKTLGAALLAAVLLGASGGAVTFPAPATAQNLFAPRLYVNDQVITEYEVIQRALFLQLLNAPGDPETEAVKSLIDDRLRMTEAKRLGVKLTPEELANGMEEFASRASLTADQLIAELQKVGIAPETYRDFVQAGATWRKIIRDKYTGRVPVSEADVDKFLDSATRPRALKVLVSELVIPAEPGQEQAALALAKRLSEEISTEGGFAAAARQHSAAPTAPSGGRIPDWLPLSNLPPAISSQLLALGEGDVSAPVVVPGAVVLFQLRGIAKDESAEPVSVSVEWADLLIANDPAELARIRAGADTCNDLYALARGLPPEQLTIRSQNVAELSPEVGLELAKLDLNEFAVLPRGDGAARLIMLCKRQPVTEAEPNRERIKEQILNQKLDGMAENYLEELRHAALIREP